MIARTAVLVASLLVANVEAFWRLPCGNSLVIERADTIVSPYQVSGHVHNILGGSNFALGTTYEELRQSECSSCLIKPTQDASNYWTPQLYFQWKNGSFSSVSAVGGGLIYYLPRFHPTDKTNVTAFPPGFRVLTGNPFKRFYDPTSDIDQAIGWNCLGAPVSATRQPYLPPYNCPNGLRGEVRFPSCWNGVDVQSSDFKSHMAYPIGGESGPCPSTHPVRLVTLFYEIMWSVDPWNKYRDQAMNSTQPFVLAMGDSTGYGYHGDFFSGWDPVVLQKAIDTCTSDSGIIEYCDVFDLYDPGHSCRKTPDVDEVVLGTLSTLPGCNPVTGFSDGYATPCSGPSAPTFNKTDAYTGAAPDVGSDVPADQPRVVTSYKEWTYQDCYSDLVNGRALPHSLTLPNRTVEACLDTCAQKGYLYCGIEYGGRECWASNTLGANSTALGAGACGLACVDNPLQYCGGSGGPGHASFELYTRPNTTRASSSSSASTVSATKASSSVISSVVSSSAPASSVASSAAAVNSTVSAGAKTTATKPVSTGAANSTVIASTASSATRPTVPSSVSSTISLAPSASSSKLSSSVVSSATTSTTTSVKPASPTQLATTAEWSYKGCYTDLVNGGRSLPNTLTSQSNFTIESCLAAARAGGFALAGLSYYGECYAGAAISPYSSTVSTSRCNMVCRNNPTELCGGSGVLDVYASSKIAALSGPKNLTTFGGFNYDACYKDLVNNQRVLSNQLTGFNKTIEGCLSAAAAKGATVVGLSYYDECWYSTGNISSTSYAIDESNCRFPCKGNPNEMCGGNAALSVWRTPTAQNSTAATKKSTVPRRRGGRRQA
ncbi:hypothetical protein JCM10212_000915 [Sporobolomyces blumeae]